MYTNERVLRSRPCHLTMDASCFGAENCAQLMSQEFLRSEALRSARGSVADSSAIITGGGVTSVSSTSDGTSASNSSSSASLGAALDDIDASTWRCGAFPDPKNYAHFAILIALNVAIMLPVKFTLITVFTRAGKTLLEPHWKHALAVAGLAYLEVWARLSVHFT